MKLPVVHKQGLSTALYISGCIDILVIDTDSDIARQIPSPSCIEPWSMGLQHALQGAMQSTHEARFQNPDRFAINFGGVCIMVVWRHRFGYRRGRQMDR
jgi:hypothetical protein